VVLIDGEGRRTMSFFRDLRVAFQSLMRSKGLAAIVILTLALGIGANAAIFTLVRGVLLKPLVNRDGNRLIYIRQSAPGLGDDNVTFSVPELKDIETSVHSVSGTEGEDTPVPPIPGFDIDTALCSLNITRTPF
jgi:hypothetical protein